MSQPPNSQNGPPMMTPLDNFRVQAEMAKSNNVADGNGKDQMSPS